MFQRTTHQAALVLCVIGASHAFAEATSWTDAKSGREYLLLDEELTNYQAETACESRGFALFDLRYVTDDERSELLVSPALEKLGWEKLYAGTSRETRVTKIWQGAQHGIMDTGYTQVILQKRGDKTTTTLEWHGEEDTGRAICMATESFWYFCNVHWKCTYKTGSSEYSMTSTYGDYGTSENDAMRRIVERTQDPIASGDGKCVIDAESRICRRLLP